MTRQVMLLAHLEDRAKLKAADRKKFNDTVEKALRLLVKSLPLNEFKGLPRDSQSAIRLMIAESLSPTDLKAISRLWSPKKKWPKDASASEIAAFLDNQIVS